MAISKITNYILKIIFWSINWLILAIYGIFSLFQRSISGKQIFILMCIVSVLHGIIFLYNVVKFSYYSAQGIIVMQRSEIISCIILCTGFLVMIIGGGMVLISKDDKSENIAKNTIIISSLIVILGCVGLSISMF